MSKMPPAQRGTSTPAGPWDALLRVEPQRMTPRADDVPGQARQGTKLSALLAELSACGRAPTLALAVRSDLTPNQVWGLLKAPRAIGEVQFRDGCWSLVPGFAGRDVERAAALLRERGWRVEPPSPSVAVPLSRPKGPSEWEH